MSNFLLQTPASPFPLPEGLPQPSTLTARELLDLFPRWTFNACWYENTPALLEIFDRLAILEAILNNSGPDILTPSAMEILHLIARMTRKHQAEERERDRERIAEGKLTRVEGEWRP